MLLHMPWNENLGGPKPQIELAREFEKLGHKVEKFDLFDAFPKMKAGQSRIRELIRPSFSSQARAFVRANAHRFDIIDCHHGNLPFSKTELGFRGLLVARSAGLYALYDEFASFAEREWSSQRKGHPVAEFLRTRRGKREARNFPASLQTCDLINVSNVDERACLAEMGLAEKCVVIPLGLSREQRDEFASAARPAAERLSNKRVVFIGSWSPRKGSKDWGEIVRRVKQRVPEVCFSFLGTGFDDKTVLSDLGLSSQDWIEVIPRYDNKDLPRLLSEATVGGFPSYIEGFGLAVLEQLAAGLPTVAYDAPGPRETLRHLESSWLVPPGDKEKFSDELVELLTAVPTIYGRRSEACQEVAAMFSWPEIAERTLEVYSRLLEAIQSNGSL
ncbi:MAG TPA: glycosyltransferase family 4 protein [Blastocatellia bacterium]|nr:glycosyltransferase family 4 protein [Blastocatellia bacterium]